MLILKSAEPVTVCLCVKCTSVCTLPVSNGASQNEHLAFIPFQEADWVLSIWTPHYLYPSPFVRLQNCPSHHHADYEISKSWVRNPRFSQIKSNLSQHFPTDLDQVLTHRNYCLRLAVFFAACNESVLRVVKPDKSQHLTALRMFILRFAAADRHYLEAAGDR